MPDLASIHMAAASAGALDLDFWDDVYGFAYRPVKTLLLEASLKDAIVAQVDARHLVTAPCCLRSFDLASVNAADADFTTDFVLEAAASVRALTLPPLLVWSVLVTSDPCTMAWNSCFHANNECTGWTLR